MPVQTAAAWQKTDDALSALESLLICASCGKLPLHPCRYGNCDHTFCSDCANANKSGLCTSCGVPSEAKERQDDTMQSHLVTCCLELRTLLGLQASATSLARPAAHVRQDAAAQMLKDNEAPVVTDNAAPLAAYIAAPVSADIAAPLVEDIGAQVVEGTAEKVDGSSGRAETAGEDQGTNAIVGSCLVAPDLLEENNLERVTEMELVDKTEPQNQLCETKKKVGGYDKNIERNINPKVKAKATKSFDSVTSEKSSLAKTGGGNQLSTKQSKPDAAQSKSTGPAAEKCSAVVRPASDSSTQRLSSTTSLHKRNSKGETPLHAACVQGRLERVQALLEAGAAANTQDHAGWTPLHEACDAGRLQLVQLLLSAGAVPDPPGHQLRTPLHEAVSARRAEVVAVLVRAGADPDARCLYGTTPRQLAQQAGADDILALLSESASVESVPEPTLEPFRAISVAWVNLSSTQLSALKSTAPALGWKLASNISETTTHLVCGDLDGSDSMVRLRALLVGAVVVAAEWVAVCAEQAATVSAEPWEIGGDAGQRSCRRRRLLQPPLLTGLHIYLQGAFSSPSRSELTSLVQLAGARVIRRAPNPEAVPLSERTVPYHARRGSPLADTSHLVVFEEAPAIQYDMRHVKSLPLAWLLLSLETHTLADPIR